VTEENTLRRLLPLAAQIVPDYALYTVVSIGSNLKRIRGEEDQRVIAQRMGVPQARLSNWEKDRYGTLTAHTLLWLAKGYRCRVDDILRGVDADYDAIHRDGEPVATRLDTLQKELEDERRQHRRLRLHLQKLISDVLRLLGSDTQSAKVSLLAGRMAHLQARDLAIIENFLNEVDRLTPGTTPRRIGNQK
jgi:transcriptional regulator with XRE-family HTH domain